MAHITPSGGGGGASTPQPGQLLAATFYDNAGTAHSYTTASSTSADIDATNLAVTFTAPASGIVIVRLSGFMQMSAATDYAYWSVREGAADLTTKQNVVDMASGTGVVTSVKTFRITGVSAGSHTYKWGFASGSGTQTFFVGALSLGDVVASMEVLIGI